PLFLSLPSPPPYPSPPSLHDALPICQPRRSQIKQQTPALFGAKPRQPHRDAAIVVNEGQVKHATVEAGDFGYVVAASQSPQIAPDRKSTRLNSSHVKISYAVFCLKKK